LSRGAGTIALGCDHAGVALKAALAELARARGLTVLDHGTDGPASVDYPDLAEKVCASVLAGEARFGLLICGTGIGMSIAANRHHGIRAALCHTEFEARATRAHNDANVLCLGERVTGPGLAAALLSAFLDTPYEGGRHQRRVEKLEALGRG